MATLFRQKYFHHLAIRCIVLLSLLSPREVLGFTATAAVMKKSRLMILETSSSLEATTDDDISTTATRSEVIHTIAAALIGLSFSTVVEPSYAMPPQKSYSTNARNMERLNAGDASAGSIYDNNPPAPAARKRRAMQGCKISSARNRAGEILKLNNKSLSEKDCNMQVMNSSPDFMLQAMQELECPTCPYGIKP